jgi:hypothetical protein
VYAASLCVSASSKRMTIRRFRPQPVVVVPGKAEPKKSFQYMIVIKKGLEAVASRADATVRAKWRAV